MKLPNREGVVAFVKRWASITAIMAWVVVFSYIMLDWAFGEQASEVLKAWILLGEVGFIVTVSNLKDSIQDRAALRVLGKNGDLERLAKDGIRTEIVRIIQCIAVMAIGVIAASATPTLTAEQREKLHIPVWTPTSITLTAGLLLIIVGIVVQSVLDRHVRKTFYERAK